MHADNPLVANNGAAPSVPSLMWKQKADEVATHSPNSEAKVSYEITHEPVPDSYSDLVSLQSIQLQDGRTVSYAIAGDAEGTPILFWYAGGGNRRILLMLQEAAEDSQIRLICVNRPGRGSTSIADYEKEVENEGKGKDEQAAEEKEFCIRVVLADEYEEESSNKSSPRNKKDNEVDKNSKLLSASHARIHLKTCLTDAIAVLDALEIERVGQCYECSGAPFALAFAQFHANRLLVDKPMIGIGSWVQPADCNETKKLFQFGARKCPVWMIAPLVSGSIGSLDKSASWVPASWIGRQFIKHLTVKEKDVLEANWEIDEFIERFRFMQQEGGGTPMADLTVLLSPSKVLGLDYSSVMARVILVHAMDDRMTPLPAAQWLNEQLPNCRLIQVADATHEGMLFLLHHEIEQSLKFLVKGEVLPIEASLSEEELPIEREPATSTADVETLQTAESVIDSIIGDAVQSDCSAEFVDTAISQADDAVSFDITNADGDAGALMVSANDGEAQSAPVRFIEDDGSAEHQKEVCTLYGEKLATSDGDLEPIVTDLGVSDDADTNSMSGIDCGEGFSKNIDAEETGDAIKSYDN